MTASRIISPSDIAYARSGLLAATPAPFLPKWRAARARVRAGTGRGRLLLCGTSLTQGYAAGGSASAVGAWPLSYPVRLAAELSARGIATSIGNFHGDTNVFGATTTYALYDTRFTIGANWSTDSTHSIIGGHWFPYTTGAANNLTFTPAGNIDTVNVLYWKGGVGTFTFNVDGGSSLGTSTGGSSGWATLSATVSKTTHTINIVPGNNGSLFIGGIIAYDSTVPAIDVINAGYNGATVAAYVGSAQPYNAPLGFASVAPDLTIFALDVNDMGSTSPATWSASLQTLITAAAAVGDVALMKEPPGPADVGSDVLAYQSAYQQLAITNGIPFIDMCSRWSTYASANAAMPYGSGRHPSQVGYADIAIAVADLLSG